MPFILLPICPAVRWNPDGGDPKDGWLKKRQTKVYPIKNKARIIWVQGKLSSRTAGRSKK